jgi:hypothetical protein
MAGVKEWESIAADTGVADNGWLESPEHKGLSIDRDLKADSSEIDGTREHYNA